MIFIFDFFQPHHSHGTSNFKNSNPKLNLQLSNLDFAYPNGTRALNDVSLEIRAGSRIAVIGQNGAGKTTLVKHLNGLLKPTRGDVLIGDWNTREHSIAQLARRVGFVFQNPDDQLFKTSVREEIAFGPTNLQVAAGELEARVARALELCGLQNVRDTHPYDLQLWQRRWVTIASVVAMQTPIVVLDEPTTGQDAFGLQRLADLLEQWEREHVTVIAVTHDLDFAVEQFPELLVMAQGQVIARGDARVLNDESVLKRAGLDAPQLVRLANALGWADAPVNVRAFVAHLAQSKNTD